MPNWCVGTLKIRGTFKNVRNFIVDGMRPVTYAGEDSKLTIREETDTSIWISDIKNALWLKGTRRHFCEPDYIEIDAESPDEIVIATMPFKAAWCIEADKLLELCKSFTVDLKIQGFERGMEFSQIIEIVDKKIVHDEELKYENWLWDCPCPDMGG